MNNDKVLVLAVDGGGCKGIVPATILTAIEKATNKQCIDIFPYMAGTSVGSIIVSLLSVNTSPAGILDFFKNDCPKIFTKIPLDLGLFGPKYSSEILGALLQSNLKNISLKTGRVQLLIPAFNLSTNSPFFFKSYEGDDFPLWEAALASSSAQLYFSAAKINNNVMIDGGNTTSNNPSLPIFSDLIKKGYQQKNIKILSLGCGQLPPIANPESYISTNAVKILEMTLQVLLEAGSEETDYELTQILDNNYLRINPPLNKNFALDDASSASLTDMENQTNAWLQENLEDILDFIQS